MKTHFAFLFLLLNIFNSLDGQIVYIKNRSFEDSPAPNKAPKSWKDCGFIFPGETPPDVQPCKSWMVTKEAVDGQTYVGLVVRDNNTWEAIGCELSGTLKKDSLYRFDIALCRSEIYLSPSKYNHYISYSKKPPNIIPTHDNFTTPARFRIWGGDELCKRKVLLAESPLISNNDWLLYKFIITPLEDSDHIIFEAYFENDDIKPYNGNILMDKASAFIPVNQTHSSQNPVED